MKNAVVTGASSGIGKAIYEGLKECHWNVIGMSRRGPDIQIDLSLPLPNKPIVSDQIDLLVNCAGIMPMIKNCPWEDSTKLHEIFNLNFWGTYNLIYNLLPVFEKGACIINIASTAGIRGDPFFPVYSASKAAIISLTQSLAKRCAPRLRVNCISPGFYKSNLVEGDTPEELIKTIPLGYEEEPNNLVPVILMIYNTKYMTGTNMVIDGGSLL